MSAPTLPPPKPPFRVQMTARNIVHLVLTIAIVAILAALSLGVHPPAGLTAEQIQTACYALLVGLFIPGSPIGRILDAYFPPPGAAPSSPTLADLEAAKDALAPKPQPVPPSRISGFADLRALAFVVLAALFGLAGCALLLPGCGASALQQHASGTVIAMTALRGADDALVADEAHAVGLCTDAACIDHARTAHQPFAVALDAFRVAVLAWRDAVMVALTASGPSADAMAALETAAARVVARWADVVAVAREDGVTLPSLPSSVLALVSSVGGVS